MFCNKPNCLKGRKIEENENPRIVGAFSIYRRLKEHSVVMRTRFPLVRAVCLIQELYCNDPGKVALTEASIL